MAATAKGATRKTTTPRRTTPRVQPASRAEAPTPAPSPPPEPAQVAELRARLAALEQSVATDAAAARSAGEITGPEEPDILGIPGLKPLRLSTQDDDDQPAERAVLFSIDDVDYTIPAEMPMPVAIEFMHQLAEGTRRGVGEILAQDYALTEVLGAAGYQALRSYRKLTRWQFMQVQAIVVRLLLGALELPKAQPNASGSAAGY